jgi:hypothetical protein
MNLICLLMGLATSTSIGQVRAAQFAQPAGNAVFYTRRHRLVTCSSSSSTVFGQNATQIPQPLHQSRLIRCSFNFAFAMSTFTSGHTAKMRI